MKQLLLIGALTISAIVILIACGGDNSNNSRNTSNLNTNSNANSNGSYIGNAANTVSNVASNMMTSSPETFAKDAAEGGMAEVKLGQLAAQKAKDPEVKKFGQMMVTEHGKANDELKALATKKNWQLPADIGSHQSTYDKLSKLNGADFDKEYVEEMVSDHESDLKDFQRQADNGSDPDLKAFAAKGVTMIQTHLNAIKAIQAKMNGGGGTANTSGTAANTSKTSNKK